MRGRAASACRLADSWRAGHVTPCTQGRLTHHQPGKHSSSSDGDHAQTSICHLTTRNANTLPCLALTGAHAIDSMVKDMMVACFKERPDQPEGWM